MPASDPQRVEHAVLEVLGELLGPHTARRALEVARMRVSDDAGDELERVCLGLAPMLRTLLGRRAAERALSRIQQLVEGDA